MLNTIRLLLYGQSGSGKTTLWATFPGPILALICSGGNKPGELRSINTAEYRKKINPKIVKSSDQLKELLATANEYSTVVLDHVSGLQDLTLKEILGLDELPAQKSWGLATQAQYGQSTMQCKEYLRAMLNLEGNVVIIGQERINGGKDDGLEESIMHPTVGVAVTPSLAGWLNPACDYIVQAFVRPKMVNDTIDVNGKKIPTRKRGKGVEYCVRTEKHDTFVTKFRVPKGSKLPDVIVDPTYDKILKAINGEM
jgi:hypothetical protein